MDTNPDEGLQNELSLLDAIYPSQVTYDPKSREVKYTSDGGQIQLRLPDDYLTNELPEVLSAGIAKADVRADLKRHVQSCNAGEEVLDSIIAYFIELEESAANNGALAEVNSKLPPVKDDQSKATTIVWLHHLLNTNKRKQALSPPAGAVSGITKPLGFACPPA